jgi:hypothetical protein
MARGERCPFAEQRICRAPLLDRIFDWHSAKARLVL